MHNEHLGWYEAGNDCPLIGAIGYVSKGHSWREARQSLQGLANDGARILRVDYRDDFFLSLGACPEST